MESTFEAPFTYGISKVWNLIPNFKDCFNLSFPVHAKSISFVGSLISLEWEIFCYIDISATRAHTDVEQCNNMKIDKLMKLFSACLCLSLPHFRLLKGLDGDVIFYYINILEMKSSLYIEEYLDSKSKIYGFLR